MNVACVCSIASSILFFLYFIHYYAVTVVKSFHLINHANYSRSRVKESHNFGCNLVRTEQPRLKSLCQIETV